MHITPRTVDVHVAKLRQKIKAASGDSHRIETIWGIGYRLWINHNQVPSAANPVSGASRSA
jgi:DNA-binding response OmpR family regulator